MVLPAGPHVVWESCEDQQAATALSRLTHAAPASFAGSKLVAAHEAPLPFYASHRLIELALDRGTAYVLHGPATTHWLDGTSEPIHFTNAEAPLALTDANVLDYVRFFFYFVRGGDGAFVLVESADDLDGQAEDLAKLRAGTRPATVRGKDGGGRWLVDATVAFGDTLFAATVAVPLDGAVEMIDDDPIGVLDGIGTPTYASLALETQGDHEPTRDRDVTEAVVCVLLEDAIRESDGGGSSMLLRHFNSVRLGDGPADAIEQLTRLLVDSVPIVIVESDIPFVEDFVAGLLDGPDQRLTHGAIDRAEVVEGDELRCRVSAVNPSIRLHLLSFHSYRRLFDAERTAHELALADAAVLIGCERIADVPEPLRRIADLLLSFPRIDRNRFARIFERVFGEKPAAGWEGDTDWTRYLLPADFHAPRRLHLDADAALEFLRERVDARLAQVVPDVGPALHELHGLGEARQICEDVVADVTAAQAGRIPWSAVDKGLLLVGAPGTGKTTLARALAKECGIKFIVSSAAAWQSAGALDAHLLAMRADFTEARRYAPAILFIDEIDSIGSREQLGGDRNVIYQTEVINALLEQIQGIATSDPVIVIGATNYPENVDPALRRSGRLDQAVRLPLPNVASLEQIFAYYLAPYRSRDEVAPGVSARPLAELSLGLTGADVEFFVRGAARRARRADRKIEQEDLMAEVTHRPRREDSAPRLGPDEIRRVAVHEAGHAVARMISSTRGEDVTFVSIIPRLDGTLGFVASLPTESHVDTRRTMLEELETVLAGRAAEEVVFGADDIGAGAGGPSRTSDLAVATRLATLIVCQSGLGGGLHWTERPTPVQETEIDALLVKAYAGIAARLRERRALLDEIAGVLVDRQEVAGAELRVLLDRDKRAALAAVVS